MNIRKGLTAFAASVVAVAGCINAQAADNKSDSIARTVPGLKLNNGAIMPQFGLGVYQIKDGENAYNAVLTALKNGYRHIDTAHAYQNERSVGKAIKPPRGCLKFSASQDPENGRTDWLYLY